MLNHFKLVTLSLTALCCSANDSANPTIVFDDQDVYNKTHTKKGDWDSCLKDAYKGQFLHNGGDKKNGRHSSAMWKFDPPRDGCYLVEEYHPGADYACSKYLHKAVKFEIGSKSCWNKVGNFHAEVGIDQSINGGQWNIIGQWKFKKGKKSGFKISAPAEKSCSSSCCMWVADAFRLTWTGATCSEDLGPLDTSVKPPPQPQPSTCPECMALGKDFCIATSRCIPRATFECDGPEDHITGDKEFALHGNPDGIQHSMVCPEHALPAAITPTITPAQDYLDEMYSAQVRGTVSLMVTSTASNEELRLKVRIPLEMGLKAQFGHTSVNVISIDIASQRRLSEKVGTDTRIDAVFEAKGTKEDNDDGQSLTQRLQVLFDATDAGIQVKSASVSWDTPSTEDEPDTVDSPVSVLGWICLGGGLLVGALVLAVVMRKVTQKMGAKKQEATVDPEKAMETKEEFDHSKEEFKEQSKDEDTVSVSTAPPASDAGVCSETGSATVVIAPVL